MADEPASGHAIVIGASMAGLLAARVLCDHFARVTVVERDALPENVQPRKGGRAPALMTVELILVMFLAVPFLVWVMRVFEPHP